MDLIQENVVVDKLVTAINMAAHNGVDIKGLADKLQDGVLSEHETAQLRAQVRDFIAKREARGLAAQYRLMAENMRETAAASKAEAEDNPNSKTLRDIAAEHARQLVSLEQKANQAEEAAA